MTNPAGAGFDRTLRTRNREGAERVSARAIGERLPRLRSDLADRLGVKLDTLYAYVSRGLLRSIEVAGSRERHYDADEVET